MDDERIDEIKQQIKEMFPEFEITDEQMESILPLFEDGVIDIIRFSSGEYSFSYPTDDEDAKLFTRKWLRTLKSRPREVPRWK